eukprot:348043-Alexandrium_andersonii.AAC.1
MSASLVGSEMCIRDRFQGWPAMPSKAQVWPLMHVRCCSNGAGPIKENLPTLTTKCSALQHWPPGA